MSTKCKKDEILKSGYTRKDGIKVKPTCIKDKGNPGKGPKLFTLEKDVLSQYGYSGVADLTERQRHIALNKALRDNGANQLAIYRRLVALSVLHKNTSKKLSDIYKEDSEWVKTTKEYINRNN